MLLKYAVLALYALMIVTVLIVTAKKSLSLNDFLLGGRHVGPWMSALSYGASYFSAVIIVGYAGSMGFEHGISAAWAGIGNALIGSLLAWGVLARPVRRMGEKLSVSTLPSFFHKRYNSRAMKLCSAWLIFIFLLPYSASVYKGLGTVFQMALGIDYTWCVIGIALLASLYLFAGGYKATAVTDFIQGLIMVVGIVLVIYYIIRAAGGLTDGLAALGELGAYNSMIPTADKLSPLLTNVLLTSVGVLALPQMVHKFFAIKDERSVKRAAVISTLFALIIAGGIYFAGGFSRAILPGIEYAEGVSMYDAVAQGMVSPDLIMPTLLTDQTVVKIPDALQGLFIVLLLSASISTLTALVLSSSSVITIDLLQPILKKHKPEAQVMTMRGLCVAFVILSLIINFLMQNTPIMQLMSLSWGTIAGAFLAPFIYGLLWKKATRTGALSGMIVGGLLAMVPPIITGMNLAPLCGVLGMAAGMIVVPVVSLLTQKQRATVAAADVV